MNRIGAIAGVLAACLAVFATARAEEGMWTFDNLPMKEMQDRYRFAPSQDWLANVQHAALRLKGGCSASFVSRDGLILTNRHCVDECLAELSTPNKDYIDDGFYARGREEEVRCPEMEADELEASTDVTDKMAGGLKDLNGSGYAEAFAAMSARLEQDCDEDDPRRWNCQVVDLYHGGRYALYKYRRYQDLRLVFAPESAIADFGGDPDNFNFPRYALDAAILRAYDRDQPVQAAYLRFAAREPAEDELVFTAGNPGATERGWTLAELKALREDDIMPALVYYSELRGILEEFAHEGPQQQRLAYANLQSVDNVLKSDLGQLDALQDPQQLARKSADETALRDWVLADPARVKQYGDPWSAIADAMVRYRSLVTRYRMLEQSWGFESRLFDYARMLLRGTEERAKANGRRLAEFRDVNLPQVKQALFTQVPISPDYEELMLGWSLTRLRAALGADDPLIRQLLGKDSPEQVAHQAVEGSRLDSASVRRHMWEDPDFLDISHDPMIRLAFLVDKEARAVRTDYESEVQAVVRVQNELISRARFARDDGASYPDATFTLRLSYGQVQGWEEGGRKVPAFTDFAGLYARATGSRPFRLPPSWVAAQASLDGDTRMNFVTTNDIVGGSSGSPVIDRDGEVVGLVFDGNIHSLGGDFWYDPASNRAVALDNRALLAALRKVYAMPALADELSNGHG
ncbi:MAG: S46 family peptidase [Bacillota bacterium]